MMNYILNSYTMEANTIMYHYQNVKLSALASAETFSNCCCRNLPQLKNQIKESNGLSLSLCNIRTPTMDEYNECTMQ